MMIDAARRRFRLHEKVVGGAVRGNYIGAVEEGVVDGLLRGPLAFRSSMSRSR